MGERLPLRIDGPAVPPLRVETVSGGRLMVRQGAEPVLFGVQRVTHRGLHYARTGRYVSPVPPLRAERARAFAASRDAPGRWSHHFRAALRASTDGPLHEGDWRLLDSLPGWFADANWPKLLAHDPERGHLTWFGYGDPVEDARDLLPLRRLSAPDAPRVKAYRRQYREGVLPPVLLWWISGLNSPVVLDGHDRLTAALAEGGRPELLVLTRAVPDGWAGQAMGRRVEGYQEHVRAREREGGPLSALLIAHESRRFAADLTALEDSAALTRGWPLAGGPDAWQRAVDAYAPGWAPDPAG
ncbi:hypothetical protein [Streptomyces sp. NBC_00083]|uniref:hypothetical protein n=1 Tax=Streptomyces sp. NBC_00083 TaxID=2975647 RepID=UPI00225B1568|nr:hypothetical protein [Streptomyces sp. NBC_00083]MCX5386521.1 hypothetical protein [Streptomyces sp. NBC_00083]